MGWSPVPAWLEPSIVIQYGRDDDLAVVHLTWRHYGVITILMQPSCLRLNMSNPCGASASFIRCVTTKLGSMSPWAMRSNSGFRYRWQCVWPVLIVNALFITAPIGILSINPP